MPKHSCWAKSFSTDFDGLERIQLMKCHTALSVRFEGTEIENDLDCTGRRYTCVQKT